MNKRIQEIYDVTKEELLTGEVADYEDYIPIIKGLIREQDYEACQGIINAIQDTYGVLLTITDWSE
jgi:hypothetical protein